MECCGLTKEQEQKEEVMAVQIGNYLNQTYSGNPGN